MKKIALPCTKTGSYEFVGQIITGTISNKVTNRWHEISVYVGTDNNYVLAVSYKTQVVNESDLHFVDVFDKLFALDATLMSEARNYLPIIPDKDDKFVREIYIPLETSFQAACSKISKNLNPFIKAEVKNDI